MNIIDAIKSGKRFRTAFSAFYTSPNDYISELGTAITCKQFIELEVEIEEEKEEKRELTRSQIEKAVKEHFFGSSWLLDYW